MTKPGWARPERATSSRLGHDFSRLPVHAPEAGTTWQQTDRAADRVMALHGGGQPLSADQLGFFEPRFDADFSKVRVHRGAQAVGATKFVGARAYTLRHDIVFGEGEYHPDTPSGRRLLAHELTHVLQQVGNRSAQGHVTHGPVQIQRAPLEGCNDAQAETVNHARDQALLDLSTAIPLLEPRPLPQPAQDAMWLTFRDTDDLKAFIVTEFLRMIKDRLPDQEITCEQKPYHLDDCKEGAGAGTTNSGRGYTHLCMDYWDNSREDRARTLIHEVAHRFIIGGRSDRAYFYPDCGASSRTMGLSVAQLFQNADSYACLAYLLAHQTAEGLRERVLHEQGRSPPPAKDKITATISFGTNSQEPDGTALATLASQLAIYHVSLHFAEYHIQFDGYASRTGDDDYNQLLSEQRAQAVKDRLEPLLGTALGDPEFKLVPAQTTVEGHGEERAREAGKPTNDDSASDRVVDVVFQAK
jgi:outer membrane protein OmpA-like peptidoglycan-associated protein